MIDMQTATDVTRQGGIWIDRAIIALILANLGGIAAFITMIRRQNRKNASFERDEIPAPGDAESCKKHSDRLTKVETKVEAWDQSFKEFRTENREDHKRIFDKLDEK